MKARALGLPPRAGALRLLAATGAPVVAAARWVAFTAGLAAAVARFAARPRSWRRPVRAAFRAALHEAGGRSFAAVMVAAVLIGVGMVFQALFWLGAVGQGQLVGTVLTTVLVREVAPVAVGLLVLGRAGMATLIALGAHQRSGRIAALDAQGVDPLLLLVMPRVIAAAVASVTLTILFVTAALLSGWTFALLVRPAEIGLFDFLDNVLRAMGASTFILLPLKGVLIGFVVTIVAAALVVGAEGPAEPPERLAPQGFALMLLAALAVSGIVSTVL